MTPVYDLQIPVDLLHEGKADEAIPMLQFIADAMPSHVTVHVLLAQALTREERWEEAKIAWQNAAFLMPNSPAIRRGFHHVLSVLSRLSLPPGASVSEVPVSESEAPVPEPAPKEAVEAEPQTSRTPKNAYTAPLPPALASLTRHAEIEDDDELDDLIQELETARIVPKPENEMIESPVLENDIDDMVSETLARIFEGQKQFDEAARVYDRLATLQPERADDFTQKASDLRARAANESD